MTLFHDDSQFDGIKYANAPIIQIKPNNLSISFCLPVNFSIFCQIVQQILEGVLILQNKSRKLKMVVDNAILQNYAVPSENISERIKIKTENGFYLKVNVGIFRRNENRLPKTGAPQAFATLIFQM